MQVLGEDRIHEPLGPDAVPVGPQACKQIVQDLAGKELEHLLHAHLLGNCFADLGDVVDDVRHDWVSCHGVQDVHVLVLLEAVRFELLVFAEDGLRLVLLRPFPASWQSGCHEDCRVLLGAVVVEGATILLQHLVLEGKVHLLLLEQMLEAGDQDVVIQADGLLLKILEDPGLQVLSLVVRTHPD